MNSVRSSSVTRLRPAIFFALTLTLGWTFDTPKSNGFLQVPVDEERLLDSQLVDENSVFVQAPREALRPLLRAEKAIQQQEFDRAVELLGELITQPDDQDYLVKIPGQFGAVTSLKSRARNVLGSLPLKARELFRVRYGIEAKQALQNAVASADEIQLSDVMQRYFYTPAGYEAALVLGYLHLEQGRPVAAGQCFQRIVETPEAREQFDPEASILLATCWVLTDATEQAEQVLKSLARNRNFIEFNGERVELFADPDDAIPWLHKLVGDSPLSQNQVVREWVMFRGNSQRNVDSGTGFPLSSLKWSIPTATAANDLRLLQQRETELVRAGNSTVPAVQPLAVGDTVVIRMIDRIAGLNAKSGKIEWLFPNLDEATFFTKQVESIRLADDQYNKTFFSTRMWKDHLFGQMTSNRRSIFLVPNPGFVNQTSRTGVVGRATVYDPLDRRQYNELIAVDVQRQGAINWQVGGETGLDEPKLAKAYFLGPPLPLDGQLLAIIQQSKEIRLVGLDAATGQLLWSRNLASTERAGNVSTNRTRRLAGVTPSYADGLVVCPTGVGAIVAVDMSTRSILWGHQYASAKDKSSAQIQPYFKSSMDDSSLATKNAIVDGAWKDSTVLISKGSVLISPSDRQQLYCFDLLTGKPRWADKNLSTVGIPREESLYVACAKLGVAVLVGLNDIRAIDLISGAETWRTATAEFGAPAGYGFYNSGSYYYPTTKNRIVKVNVRSGAIENTLETQQRLGNLINYRGLVISHSATRVVAFPQLAKEVAWLKSNPAPSTIEGQLKRLNVQLQLSLQTGQTKNALEKIDAIIRLNPSRSNQRRRREILLKLFQTDYEFAAELPREDFLELRSLNPLAFYQTTITSHSNNGRTEQAWSAICELVREIPNSEFLTSTKSSLSLATIRDSEIDFSQTISLTSRIPDVQGAVSASASSSANQVENTDSKKPDDQRIELSLDTWIQYQITNLARSYDVAGNVVELFNQKSKNLSALGPRQWQAKTRLATMLSLPKLAPRETSNLAIDAFEASDLLSAQELLKRLRGDQNRDLPNRLIQLDTALNANQSAVAIATPPNRWSGFQSQIEPRRPFANPDEAMLSRLNRIKMEFKSPESTSWFSDKSFYFYPNGTLEICDSDRNTMLRANVRSGAQEAYTFPHSSHVGQLYLSGGILIGHVGREIFAIHCDRLFANEPCILWSRPGATRLQQNHMLRKRTTIWKERYSQLISTGAFPNTVICEPSIHGLCIVEDRQLSCLDIPSGRTLWKNEFMFKDPVLCLKSQQTAVIFDQNRKSITEVDLKSGIIQKRAKLANYGRLFQQHGPLLLFSKAERRNIEAGNELPVPESARGTGLATSGMEKKTFKRVKVLSWFDTRTSKLTWQHEFENETIATRVGEDKLLMLDQNNDLSLLHFSISKSVPQKAPTTVFTRKLLPGKEVPSKREQGMLVQEYDNCYLVVFLRKVHTSSRFRLSQNAYIRYLNSYKALWNGDVMAFDKSTGAPLWNHLANLVRFQLLDDVPAASPVALFVRRIDIRNLPSAIRNRLQIVALDLATGVVGSNELMEYSYQINYRVQLDRKNKSLYFDSPVARYRLSDSGESPPPLPVANVNYLNSFSMNPDFWMPPTSQKFDREAELEALRERLEKTYQSDLDEKRRRMRKLLERQQKDK